MRILPELWITEVTKSADVQTAFLYGESEEEIFIKIPPGYEEYLKEIGEQVKRGLFKVGKVYLPTSSNSKIMADKVYYCVER